MTSPKVASIAAKGINDPASVSDAEVQSLAASALAQTDADENRRLRIEELDRLANKRRGKPGFETNVQDIEARLERLRAGGDE